MSTANTQKILFIDSAVGDLSSILASVDPSFEVVLLSSERNGLEQIADALAGRTGVDAVHVISHGGAGYLQLGDSTLDLSGLDSQPGALATIRDALSDSADLLLYGCDVAAGDTGMKFIDALAAATGADVAASLDPTGPALLGGDGTLESNTGSIEAEVLDLIGIETLLAAPANDGFENNFTGWTTSDAVIGTGGVYATDGPDWTVNPYGTKMAVVQPAGASGEKTGTYDTLGIGSAARTYLDGRFPNPTNYGYIYTTVTLAAGEEFSMAWNYVATDYSPYNDASVVTFVNTSNTSDLSMQIKPGADSAFSGGQVGILGATVAGTGNYVTGNYGSTGWQVVTLKAGEAGTYKLGFAVFNLGDTVLSPYLFVDQAQGSTLKDGTPFGPVPAPAVQPPPPVTNAAPAFSATTHTNGSTLTDTAADDSFATLTGKVNATDSNNDTLTFAVSGATSGTTVKTGVYGTFTITNTATGAFTYTPNDAAIEGRKTGTTESFTVNVSDGKGGSASTTVTFTIAGANDTTVFSGTTSGAVAEDGTASASGTVSAADRDTGDATLVASAATSVYGTFVVNAAGQWSYTLNNGNTAVQGLTQGQTVNDTFYVGTAGGSSQAVTITITGQNDRPTLSSNAALLGQVEDSTDNTATSIATLLSGRFADVDNGSSFAGVLVAGNASTGAQGVWQYQLSGSVTWVDIPAAGLTTSHALALSADTLVRFVPAPDYNGTPGSLSVYAADNVYAGGFSTGTEVFADVTVGGVSAAGRAVSITITPANDAPVFSGSDASIGLTEGAGADTTASLQADAAAADPVVALTGTIAATDVDNASNTLTYGIQGGQSGSGAESGLIVLQGTYGRLTLDPVSGDWTYSPTNTAAINALEAGEVGVETFTFKVTDGAGASDTQTLSVSITGTDDTPVLASALADTTVTGGQWTYQIPVEHFTDAEGKALTYTVELVDVNGDPVGDGSLPAGLTFDGTTRTFTGASPLPHTGQSYYLKVTADDGTVPVDDVFRLTVANTVPVSSNDSGTVVEDMPRVLTLADFGQYTDADGDALSAVQITGLPGAGTLELHDGSGWVAVNADQIIGVADIAAGLLRFVPPSDLDGGNVDLLFKVSDGLAFSASDYTLSLSYAPAADAPVVSSAITDQSVAQDATLSLDVSSNFSDVDASTTLSYSATLSNGDPLPAWLSINASTGVFSGTPAAGDVGALNVTVTAWDGGAVGSGLSASDTFTLTVANVDDAPTQPAAIGTVTAHEDLPFAFKIPNLPQVDADGQALTYSIEGVNHGALPGWLSYDAATGVLSGTPSQGDVGSVTLRVYATDGTTETGRTFTLNVANVNDEPTGTLDLTSSDGDLSDLQAGDTLTATPNALADVDGGVGALTYQWYANGVAISGANASTYTLTASEVGKSIVAKVSYTDGQGSVETVVSGSTSTVNDGSNVNPTFDDSPFISYRVIAQTVDEARTINLVNANLKVGDEIEAWIGLEDEGPGNPTGVALQWMADGELISPAVTGDVITLTEALVGKQISFVITYTDGQGNQEAVISPATPRVQSLPSSTNDSVTIDEDSAYALTLADFGSYSNADGDPLAAVKITSLPAAGTLLLDGAGVTSGTVITAQDIGAGKLTFMPAPNASGAGYASLGFQVGDAWQVGSGFNFSTSSYTLTFNVSATDDAPTVASPTGDQNLNQGSTLNLDAGSAFAEADATTLKYSATLSDGSPLPAWMTFDQDTGVLGGTPGSGDVGTWHVTVTAWDGGAVSSGNSVSDTFSVTVANTNDAPTVAQVPGVQTATQGNLFTYAVPAGTFADADAGDAPTYTVELVDTNGDPVGDGSLPDWLTFDPVAGVFSGTPENGDVGTFHLKLTATDGNGQSASTTFDLTVNDVNDAPVVSAIGDQTLAQVQSGISLAGVFTDPDGDSMTLTPTLANGDPLPGWLLWDADTQTLSGNPPGGTAYVDIKLVAEDPSSSTAETSFRINLTDAGQTPNTMIGTLAANNAGTVSVAASGGSDPYPLGTVLTATVSDADGFNSANVVYQWQVSADGSTWSDIAGASGASFTLAQAQSDQQVRVQVFYNDNGSVLEMPVSTAVGVALTDQAGAVTVSGSPAAGQTLQATLTDPDGLLGATPIYTWQTSANGSTGWTQVATGASNAYTLTNNDGGQYVRVVVTYVDDANTPVRTVTGALSSGGSPVTVQLGAVSPVPADKTASALEAGGVADATAGSNPTGNLLTGATDANAGDVISFDSVRTGSALGLGTPALPDPESAGDVVLQGTYGQLRVNTTTGAYSYTVDNSSASVQALSAGQQVTDSFNYSVKDATDLTGSALLTFTVTGADDAPAGTGLPASATVTEDVTTAVDLSGLSLSDFDGAVGEVYAISVSAGTAGAVLAASSAGGVVVTGSGTGTITFTGTLPNLNAFIDNTAALTYTSQANDDTADTLAVQLHYGVGQGSAVSLGSVAVGINPVNDVPTLDLDANNSSGASGTGYLTSFQPRSGVPVAVVDSDMVIADVDTVGGLSDTIGLASIAVAGGALDNVAQTFETLTAVGGNVVTVDGEVRFTFGNYDAADSSTYLVVAGNGTSKITFLGEGTHAQYEAALKSVVYENASPFASGGTRTITVTVTDGATTGGDPLSVSATTTLLQPWTPVVDLNGDSDDVFDRDHAVAFTEDGAPVAIAASDASLTDLDSNIQQVTVTLRTGDAGAPVGAEDELVISPALVSLLAAAPYNITTVISGDKHTVTFTGDNTSSVFQVALRAVQYQNTSESPTVPLVRHVDVTTLDVNSHVGVPATTTISVVPVNDAPVAVADTASATEAGGVLNGTTGVDPTGNVLTNDTDPDTAGANADTQTVQSARVGNTGEFTAVTDGSSSVNGGTVLVGQYGTLTIGADGSYVYAVDNSNATVQALDDGSTALTDVFSYTLVDSGNATSTATLTVSIAGANDTPVITVDAEAGDSAAEGVTETDSTLSTSGILSVQDVDTADSVTVSVSAVVASGMTTGLQSDNAALLAMMSVDAGAVIDATQTTGTIHWAFGSGAEAFDHLAAGETLTLTYTLTVNDGTTSNTHDVAVTVTGTNDVPAIGGVNASDVTEDTTVASDQISTQGQLTIADADHGQSNFAAQASYAGTYGSFTLAADGSWTYSADNTQTVIQQLGAGESLTDSFTATSSDGTAAQLVTVTINGSNDVPTIGGVHTSSVTEDADVTDGQLSTQGQLTISDTDQGQASFAAQASHAGTYGTFTLAADGSWTYSANNTQTAIQQLAAGESLTDSFTAVSSDGSASQLVTVTIAGTNDTPVITVGSGDSVSAGITETNAAISASGTLTVNDVDASDTVVAAVGAVSVAGSFDGVNPLDNGDLLAMLSLTSGAIGANAADTHNLGWTFNSGSAAAFDFLPAGETLELTYTVQVADSANPALTASQDLTVTITGTDDKPVVDISGANVVGIDGEVVFKPRGDGVALFGSDLSVGDVDDAELLTGATLVLDSASALDNAFGTTYETLYAVSTGDAIVAGGTITVGSSVLTLSGNGTAASPLVITGAATAADYKTALQTLHYGNTNPNAFAGERVISVTVRDDGVAPANADKLQSDPAELVVNVNWTPVIDLNGALTGRNYATTYVEKQPTTTYVASSTATVFDQNGLIQSLTITLQNASDGASEALSISAATQAVLQANGIKAEVIVTGGASHQVVLSAWDFTNDVAYADGRSTSAFQIGLRGVAYANASAAPDEDTARTVLISALDVDGTAGVSAVTTINVAGVNIPPVLADVANNGDVTESDQSSAFAAAHLTGTLVATDEDLQELTYGIATGGGTYVAVPALETAVTIDSVTYQVSLDGAYGTLYVNSGTGQYVYVPDADLVDTIADGDTKTETFNVFATDGESALVVKTYTIELSGADDAPTLASVTATVAEVDLSGTTSDMAITGTLAGADVDEGAVLTYGIAGGTVDLDGNSQPTGTVSLALAYGTLVVNTTSGQYTYTKDASAVEALAVTETGADVFTVTVSDGTGALVTSTMTVTVSGANDAPVASVAVDTATEDGAVITGNVSSADVDVLNTTASYALDAAVAGLTMAADGSYSFNPANAAYQYLAAGETLDVVAAFTVTDDQGATSSNTLTITVTGTNDAPVAAVAVNTATEDGAVITGNVSSTDVDVLNTTASYALDAAVAGLTMAADGSYSFNPANAAYQYLAAGQTLDVVAAFTVTDDQGATSSNTLTITVTGTNDAPVAAADTGTAREKSGLDNTIAGFDATGHALTNDTDIDSGDTRTVVTVQAGTGPGTTSVVPADSTGESGYVAVTGQYGTLRIGADGSYRYLVDESNATVQALRTAGQTVQDVFSYTVQDGQGATASSTVTITVEGANDAPTLVRVSNLAITELTGAMPNTAGVVNVGSLTTDDPDDGDSFVYDIIGGAQQFYFQIGTVDGVATLQLRQGVPLNSEFLSELSVVVRSTDALGQSTFETFVVHVDDVNEFGVTAPTFNVQPMVDGLDPNTVPENSATDSFIGVTATAVDADATNNTITYTLVGNALGGAYTAGEFRIDATDGKVYVAGPIDREVGGGARTLFVKATSSDGSSAIRSLNLFIADENEHDVSAPVDVNAAANAVAENAPVGLNVGVTASATDADATTNTVSYSLVNADGSAYTAGEFVVGGANGVVTVAGPIDREAGATRTLYVRAVSADGSAAISSFTVNVTDVNEFTPVFASGATGSVTENDVISTVIYQAAASDGDATAVLSYSLSGADAALLDINASTGAVTLKASADFEAKPSYSFNVVASDGANSATQAVTVSVGNVDEPVTGSVAVAGVAALNQTLVVQSTLHDPDGMAALSYQWLADGEPIAGATSSQLLLGSALVGKAISAVVSYVDGTGSLVTVSSVGATDKVNAVDPTQEAAVPGLPDGDGNVVSGDGNGDGIADAQQDAVASIAANLTPSGGGSGPTSTYLSLVATDPVAHGGGSTANTGAVITSFQQGEAPDGLPANVSMPLGSISFSAQAADNGGSGDTLAVPETFSLYVDKDLGINGFWVTDADGVLYNLATAVNGGQIVEEGGKLRVDFTIPEGSDLYADMVHDGVLTVTGALGHVDDGISGVVPAPTTTAFWF